MKIPWAEQRDCCEDPMGRAEDGFVYVLCMSGFFIKELIFHEVSGFSMKELIFHEVVYFS